MKATIKYNLSSAGQKASILAGGNGQSSQEIEVNREDPSFADVVQMCDTNTAGDVILSFQRWNDPSFDAVQTAATLVEFQHRRNAESAAKEAADREAKRLETLAVLTGRKTTSPASYNLPLMTAVVDGVTGEARAARLIPDWPYNADRTVTESAEAQVWLAELAAVNLLAEHAAERAAIDDVRARIEAKRVAAEAAEKKESARIANRRRLGLGEEFDADTFIRIEDGALTSAPVWETHSRGKNWLAIIVSDPTKPGGLDRDFAVKAKGDSFYMEPTWIVGDAVEFGADYYTGGGKKRAERWYGFVAAHGTEFVVLRKMDGGKTAIKAGEKFAKAHPTPEPTFTAEGGLKPADPVTAAIEHVNERIEPVEAPADWLAERGLSAAPTFADDPTDLTEVSTDDLIRELARRQLTVSGRNGVLCPSGSTL